MLRITELKLMSIVLHRILKFKTISILEKMKILQRLKQKGRKLQLRQVLMNQGILLEDVMKKAMTLITQTLIKEKPQSSNE